MRSGEGSRPRPLSLSLQPVQSGKGSLEHALHRSPVTKGRCNQPRAAKSAVRRKRHSNVVTQEFSAAMTNTSYANWKHMNALLLLSLAVVLLCSSLPLCHGPAPNSLFRLHPPGQAPTAVPLCSSPALCLALHPAPSLFGLSLSPSLPSAPSPPDPSPSPAPFLPSHDPFPPAPSLCRAL